MLAARPWLNEPDTGIEEIFGNTPDGELIPLDGIVGLPDFEWAARKYMALANYTYYRNGAAGEWSYRNNLESFGNHPLRPRVMRDIMNIESTFRYVLLRHVSKWHLKKIFLLTQNPTVPLFWATTPRRPSLFPPARAGPSATR